MRGRKQNKNRMRIQETKKRGNATDYLHDHQGACRRKLKKLALFYKKKANSSFQVPLTTFRKKEKTKLSVQIRKTHLEESLGGQGSTLTREIEMSKQDHEIEGVS